MTTETVKAKYSAKCTTESRLEITTEELPQELNQMIVQMMHHETDAQVNKMMRRLRNAFGVETIDNLVKEMVNRFLCWKLPKDFAPDGGISFKESAWWPVGTNLLTADQAKEMLQHAAGCRRSIRPCRS